MFIYMILNTVNNKIYIGQTIQLNVKNRWKKHFSQLRRGVHGNNHLQLSWNKYGEKSFSFEIIEKVNSIEELDRLEIHYIQYYDSMNKSNGYNKQSGGHLNRSVSEETRKKLSDYNTGRVGGENNPMFGKTHTDEVKKAQSDRMKGNQYFKGKSCSDEQKAKMSKQRKGKKMSEETRRKISEGNKGRKWNPESTAKRLKTKQMMAAVRKGLATMLPDDFFTKRLTVKEQ